MNEITHTQARRYLQLDLDGLLTQTQRLDLETHLRACETCRADSDSFAALTTRLHTEFHARWDAHDGPSHNVLTNIHSRSRRIIMNNRINFVFNILGGAAALLVLGFVILSIIAQFQKDPIAADVTQTNVPASVPQPEERLIAFISRDERGNRDIFTMKADGSDLTNLTNNPATDDSPAWSPNGRQIAFVSDRSGGRDIYLMNADGSNVRKLTDSSTFNDRFTWSPDGTKIVYLSSPSSLNYDGRLMIMNADGSSQIPLTPEPGTYAFLSWSPDGRKIVYQKQVQGPNATTPYMVLDIYVIDNDGTNRHRILENTSLYGPLIWRDAQHFFAVTGAAAPWTLYQSSVDGSSSVELAAADSPIIHVLPQDNGEVVYITQDSFTSWSWWRISGTNQVFLTAWDDFADQCQNIYNLYLGDNIRQLSPDNKYIFMSFNCDGVHKKYLIRADGADFRAQILTTLDSQNSQNIMGVVDIGNWSPDGKYSIVGFGNAQNGTDLYLLDIEKIASDPSTNPERLVSGQSLKFGVVWQPKP